MIIIDDYKKILNDTRPQIAELAKGLGYERLSNEIEELEMHTHQPDFWQNRERANSIIAKINGLKKKKRSTCSGTLYSTASACTKETLSAEIAFSLFITAFS